MSPLLGPADSKNRVSLQWGLGEEGLLFGAVARASLKGDGEGTAGLSADKGLLLGHFGAVGLPEERKQSGEWLQVQGEAGFGPSRSSALLPGSWYTARTHGPWQCPGEHPGPQSQLMLAVYP